MKKTLAFCAAMTLATASVAEQSKPATISAADVKTATLATQDSSDNGIGIVLGLLVLLAIAASATSHSY